MTDYKEKGHPKKKIAHMFVAERAVTGAKNPKGTPRDRINFAVVTSRR
ncbi:MAG: hypothetical protein ACFFDU_04700 [Candidatus Thorarchaeota archaeon]